MTFGLVWWVECEQLVLKSCLLLFGIRGRGTCVVQEIIALDLHQCGRCKFRTVYEEAGLPPYRFLS